MVNETPLSQLEFANGLKSIYGDARQKRKTAIDQRSRMHFDQVRVPTVAR